MRTLISTTVLVVAGLAAAPLVGCSHAPQTSQETMVTWHREATSIPAYNAGANYQVVFGPKFTRF